MVTPTTWHWRPCQPLVVLRAPTEGGSQPVAPTALRCTAWFVARRLLMSRTVGLNLFTWGGLEGPGVPRGQFSEGCHAGAVERPVKVKLPSALFER